MNPFEYIDELKRTVQANMADENNAKKTITYQEHCSGLMNMLNVY